MALTPYRTAQCACLLVASAGCLHATVGPARQSSAAGRSADPGLVIAQGVPLRIALDRRVPLKTAGVRVQAHMTAPLYVGSTLVLPEGAEVSGTLAATPPVPRSMQWQARFAGDFTPLKRPEFIFDQATLADGTTLQFHSLEATPAGTEIRFQAKAKQGLSARLRGMVQARVASAQDTLEAPDKLHRIADFVLGQLPYHSQFVPAGAQFDADMAEAVPVQMQAVPLPTEAAPASTATGSAALITVKARLVETLDSAHSPTGTPVEAVVTTPGVDQAQRVVYPEGTVLEGTVTQSRAARWFARNGQLRFTFRAVRVVSVLQPPAPETPAATAPATAEHAPRPRPAGPPVLQTRVAINGHITSTEGDKAAHLELDDEGGVKSTGGPNKVLAPIALALLAATTQGGDGDADVGQGVVGGNFGLVGRVVILSARANAVSASFAFFGAAKSLYTHWIAKGHQVIFPHDTRVSIELAPVRITAM